MPPAQESDGSVNGGSTVARKRQRDDAEEISTTPCAQCRSRKVRCDRQQPGCSNCRRAGVPCEYSNTSTAYNVKELFDAFSSVTSRLDRMEETLAGIADYIKSIAPTPAGLQSPPTTNGFNSHAQDSGDVAPPVESTPAFVVPLEDDGRVPGDPASIALFKSLHHRLKSAVEGPPSEPMTLWAVAAKDPAVKRVLQRQLDLFPFNGGCLAFPMSSDSQPMQAPPRYSLEDCLRSSFTELHVFAPIFQKQYLEDAVAFYYDSPPCQQSQAQVLMINNIYLLAITLEARACRARRTESESRYYNLELAYALLGNCDRALRDLGPFNEPTVENVRALLSLAFVCQEYYSVPVQIHVFQLAARLARAVGLQKWHVSNNGSWDNASADESLFWLIYTMDKQQAFQSGQAGELYLHDCTLPLYPCGTGTPTIEQLHGAFTSLSTIWEDIYSSLYSVRSSILDHFTRNAHVGRLHSILSVWKEAYEPLFTSWTLPDVSNLKAIHTELQYAFLTTKLLIQRCNTCLPPSVRYREFAEPALTLLTTNFNTLSPSECTTLGRIFRNYPLVAFLDFFLYTILSDRAGLAENAQLLHAVTRLLEPFRDADFPESFYNKIYSGFTWCTNQLDILLRACTQRASITGGICPELDEMAGSLSGLAPGLAPGLGV